MDIALIIFFLVVVCFSFVLIYGAPYLPTHKPQVEKSLDLLCLEKGQTMYELGCGDGRVLKAAAKRGYKAVGYEMNPLIYVIAVINTWKYRKLVSVKFGNFWRADLRNADGVYVFLLDKFMARLDKKLSNELKPGVRLVSYTFKIPDKRLYKSDCGMFVYIY